MSRKSKKPAIPFAARHWVVLLVLGASLASLVWRAVDLQIENRAFLRDQGDARHLRQVKVPAHRGMILDRNGQPLAVSTPVDSIWANPHELATQRARWPQLAHALGFGVDYLQDLLARYSDKEFVYLRRDLAPGDARAVLAMHVPGVYSQREYRRYYPSGEVAAQVLGLTNIDDRGQEGLELEYDKWLRGIDGKKKVIIDRLGRVVDDVESIRPPHPGRNLEISIDRRIQYLAYRALLQAVTKHHAHSGSAVLLDVRTGEVLAMVNLPSFNPNNRVGPETGAYRNRAVTDAFEPGSTMKPFTISAALMSGKYTPDTLIDTEPGYFQVGRYTINDVANFGIINVSNVIKKSSNVGAGKIALSLAPDAVWKVLRRFGFGHLTGSGFPGASEGILTSWRSWSEAQRVTVAFGYGVSVTLLQLARAYAALADGGVLLPVSFLKLAAPPRGKRVLPEKIDHEITKMLEMVVGPGGTGIRAEIPGYHVAGKTGTVRKARDGGYSTKHYLAVFAGFAPATDPRLAAAVMVDSPKGGYYGGEVAAPVFRRIMEAALRLTGTPPDDVDSLKTRIVLAPPSGAAAHAQVRQ